MGFGVFSVETSGGLAVPSGAVLAIVPALNLAHLSATTEINVGLSILHSLKKQKQTQLQ